MVSGHHLPRAALARARCHLHIARECKIPRCSGASAWSKTHARLAAETKPRSPSPWWLGYAVLCCVSDRVSAANCSMVLGSLSPQHTSSALPLPTAAVHRPRMRTLMRFAWRLQFEFGRYVDRSLLNGTGLAAQASGVCTSRALVESVARREAVCIMLLTDTLLRDIVESTSRCVTWSACRPESPAFSHHQGGSCTTLCMSVASAACSQPEPAAAVWRACHRRGHQRGKHHRYGCEYGSEC